MFLAKRFSKVPWLYYLLILAINVGVVLLVLQMPRYFSEKHYEPVYALSAGVGALFLILGLALADMKGSKLLGWILAPLLCGAISALATYFFFYRIAHLSLGLDRTVALTMSALFLFLFLGVVDALIVIFSFDRFAAGKGLRVVLALSLVVVTAGLTMTPLVRSFARRYLRAYDFLTTPAVFVNGEDGYSVLFATTGPGTGSVTVRKEDTETVYYEEKQGVILYDRQIHRVDLPRTALEGATYFVSSRQTQDGSDKAWRMGKEIRSATYIFRAYQGSGDLSFLCVSDNQGAMKATQDAVKAAYKANDYDFVMMLGDHAEGYNDIETDIVEPLLKVAALASGSVLPVYYTLGNHEYRGMLAPYLWDLIPTASATGEAYYTFTMGDAFFSVINFANDHADDFDRYAGLARFNEYKDKEYEWYENKMATKPYEGYRYHLVISHIPMICENNLPAYEYVCEDCNEVHDYKYKEFGDKFAECGVQYIVSGHSHVPPAEFKSDKYDYPNLHAGSNYAKKEGFRNSIVTLSDGKITYKVYGA